jgi:hypothetical protein
LFEARERKQDACGRTVDVFVFFFKAARARSPVVLAPIAAAAAATRGDSRHLEHKINDPTSWALSLLSLIR